ncbi:MAG: hypothetical protein H6550_16055 [Chitinophagales bacterium]|nr:hypothetical protein [Chitinophagales bacterium]
MSVENTLNTAFVVCVVLLLLLLVVLCTILIMRIGKDDGDVVLDYDAEGAAEGNVKSPPTYVP